ncbi:MAG: 30S ribosomal protein S6 [Planctomycetia bacterium]|nr:30S ribosomal protein S6 [Planctomycetia bacterium]
MAQQDEKRPYEAMFVVDSARAATHRSEIEEHIRDILSRHETEIVGLSKWDDRPLAYMIQKKRRGTYILGFFHAPPDAIPAIERDCQLSEQILRVLMLRADHLLLEDMKMQLGHEADAGGDVAPPRAESVQDLKADAEALAQELVEKVETDVAQAETADADEPAEEKPQEETDNIDEPAEEKPQEETADADGPADELP